MAAMTAVATMTDPLMPDREISASAAERLAALRQPSSSKKRTKPAHTSKVLTAGISTTALFGLVAVMGWQSGMGTAQPSVSADPTTQTAAPTPVAPTVAPLVATPAGGVILVPPLPVTQAPVTEAPVATVPVTQPPVIQVPVIQVPVSVPVAQPTQTNAGRAQSNTTTKSSG